MLFTRIESERANAFAISLFLHKEESAVIDHWMESWMKLTGNNELNNDQAEYYMSLYNSLQEVIGTLTGNALKYLLGRLIKMHDFMWHGVFSPIINSSNSKIRDFIDEVLTSVQGFTPIEFTSLLAYLKGTPVNPNSDLFPFIWKIENQSSFFQSADFFMRNKALKALLDLNGERGYHHNIKHFKKILTYVKPDNIDIIHYLRHYQVKNNQGCYQVIHFIFRDLKEHTYQDFKRKKECIHWLDRASGRSPKKPWLDRLTRIQREFSEEELVNITQWILHNKHLKREQTTGWSDDTYKRFVKSSEWYLDWK